MDFSNLMLGHCEIQIVSERKVSAWEVEVNDMSWIDIIFRKIETIASQISIVASIFLTLEWSQLN